VCRTTPKRAYKSTQRAPRQGHVLPKGAYLFARIVLELRRGTEYHRGAGCRIEGRPGWNAGIVRVASPGERYPAGRKLIRQARRVVAVARLAKRSGNVEAMNGAIAAAEGRAGRAPLPAPVFRRPPAMSPSLRLASAQRILKSRGGFDLSWQLPRVHGIRLKKRRVVEARRLSNRNTESLLLELHSGRQPEGSRST
jgi:hypothetical protein